MRYSKGSFGKIQSSDIMGSGLAACTTVFSNWDSGVLPSATTQDNNIPTLKSSSPAIGKGLTSASFTYYVTSTGTNGTADFLNKDLGAFPTDNSGIKSLPYAKPVN
jgi:hypothetical protein